VVRLMFVAVQRAQGAGQPALHLNLLLHGGSGNVTNI
jgi:hypothetical protein